MNRIDKLHLEYSFAGSRMIHDFLVREKLDICRLHVATRMKRMGIEAFIGGRTRKTGSGA